jgi:hypothetical protein
MPARISANSPHTAYCYPSRPVCQHIQRRLGHYLQPWSLVSCPNCRTVSTAVRLDSGLQAITHLGQPFPGRSMKLSHY